MKEPQDKLRRLNEMGRRVHKAWVLNSKEIEPRFSDGGVSKNILQTV